MTLLFTRMALLTKLATGCAAALIFGMAFWQPAFFLNPHAPPTQMELSGERFTLEIALTEKGREKGLGGRENLCSTCAMLFVFEKPGRYAFWMKDMHFPIDIVWLSGDKVVFVAHEISPDFSGILDPAVIADRVVELSAGAAKNVGVGEKVRFFY